MDGSEKIIHEKFSIGHIYTTMKHLISYCFSQAIIIKLNLLALNAYFLCLATCDQIYQNPPHTQK